MSVTWSSFLSYAVYDCSFGAAGWGGGAGDGDEAKRLAAGGVGAGAGVGVEDVEPKRPKMSSTVLFCDAAGADGCAGVVSDDPPKMSINKSWSL